MKVVVYEPDYNKKHQAVLRALAEGIPGATVRSVTQYEPCDVAVIFGGVKKAYAPTWTKGDIIARHTAPRSLLMVESAFLKRGEYYQVGWGGAAGHADFRTEHYTPVDRWAKLGVQIRPWQHNPHGPIVVVGQLPRDVQVQDVDHCAWCRETVKYYQDRRERVVFRPHPKQENPSVYGVPVTLHDTRPLNKVLRGARAVVTWNSTTAVESVIAGVPTVALDRGSMAYDVASNRLEDLNCRPPRIDWCAGIGYSQWTLNEMWNGEPWRWLTREF